MSTRSTRSTYSAHLARTWTTAALTMLTVIVVSGATVRLTGSGMGCPDWPSCTGTRPVPTLGSHPIIEFANRLVAVPTMITTIGAWWVAKHLDTPRLDVRRGTSLVLAGVLSEIIVGGVAVRLNLAPLMVSLHFLLSIAILTAATYAWVAARRSSPLVLRVGDGTSVTAVAMLITLAAVTVAGVATTAAGPHSGGTIRDEVARIGNWDTSVTVHARGGWLFVALLVGLTIWRRRSVHGMRDLGIVMLLTGIQIMLGEIQYRAGLPWGVVLAHVTVAALLWVATCRIAFAALAEPQAGPDGLKPIVTGAPNLDDDRRAGVEGQRNWLTE